MISLSSRTSSVIVGPLHFKNQNHRRPSSDDFAASGNARTVAIRTIALTQRIRDPGTIGDRLTPWRSAAGPTWPSAMMGQLPAGPLQRHVRRWPTMARLLVGQERFHT